MPLGGFKNDSTRLGVEYSLTYDEKLRHLALKEAILDEMVVHERKVLMSNEEYRKIETWRKVE